MKDIMDDPDKAADDFVKFVPEWKGKEAERSKLLLSTTRSSSIRARSNLAKSASNG